MTKTVSDIKPGGSPPVVLFLDEEENRQHKAFERELTRCACDVESRRAWMAAFRVNAEVADDMREDAAAVMRHSILDVYGSTDCDRSTRTLASWAWEFSTGASRLVAPVLGVAAEKVHRFYWENPGERFGLSCPCKPSYQAVDGCRKTLLAWRERGSLQDKPGDFSGVLPCGFDRCIDPESRNQRFQPVRGPQRARPSKLEAPEVSQIAEWLELPSATRYMRQIENDLGSRRWIAWLRERTETLRGIIDEQHTQLDRVTWNSWLMPSAPLSRGMEINRWNEQLDRAALAAEPPAPWGGGVPGYSDGEF